MSRIWESYCEWLQTEIKNAASRLADGHTVHGDRLWRAFDDATAAHPDSQVEAQARSIRTLERVLDEEKQALGAMLVRKHESDLARELEAEAARQVVGWIAAVLRLESEHRLEGSRRAETVGPKEGPQIPIPDGWVFLGRLRDTLHNLDHDVATDGVHLSVVGSQHGTRHDRPGCATIEDWRRWNANYGDIDGLGVASVALLDRHLSRGGR